MTGNGDDVVTERLPPEEAFELLGNDIRFRILAALNDADGPLAFSSLRRAVGVEDPGKFNYHLDKVVDRFVEKTGDGYALSAPGRRVVGAVLSGGYTKRIDAEPVPAGGTCRECGAPLQARFRDEGVTIGCGACEAVHTNPDVPPGLLEGWPIEDAPEVVFKWNRRKAYSGRYGLCPNCDGRVDQTLARPEDPEAPAWFDGEYVEVTSVSSCRRCGTWWHAIVEVAALTLSPVIAFHYDHGIDLQETPEWQLEWLEIDLATVTGEDPLRVELPIELEDETLRLTFDRDFEVVEERRESPD